MIGALAGTGTLPLTPDDFRTVMSETLSDEKLGVNLEAFAAGMDMTKP
jgi:Pyruvate/2-oxoacid:ferredoxin oxidoreductase gamma subunit